jgi:hypothetical protein
MVGHVAAGDTLEPDGEGWYEAECTCGFSVGPLPGPVEVLDELMEHAAREATTAQARVQAEATP